MNKMRSLLKSLVCWWVSVRIQFSSFFVIDKTNKSEKCVKCEKWLCDKRNKNDVKIQQNTTKNLKLKANLRHCLINFEFYWFSICFIWFISVLCFKFFLFFINFMIAFNDFVTFVFVSREENRVSNRKKKKVNAISFNS